jgi:hypothetical protein
VTKAAANKLPVIIISATIEIKTPTTSRVDVSSATKTLSIHVNINRRI